jgi:hypothetical protein
MECAIYIGITKKKEGRKMETRELNFSEAINLWFGGKIDCFRFGLPEGKSCNYQGSKIKGYELGASVFGLDEEESQKQEGVVLAPITDDYETLQNWKETRDCYAIKGTLMRDENDELILGSAGEYLLDIEKEWGIVGIIEKDSVLV